MDFDPTLIAVSLVATGVFVFCFRFSGLIKVAQNAIALAREAGQVMRSKTLSDDEKEVAVQKASIGLLGAFVQITIRAAVVLGATFGVIWTGELIGIATVQAVTDFLLTWQAIVGLTVLVTLVALVWRRL